MTSTDLPKPFGNYLLLKLLARGGMGEIFLSRTSGMTGFEKYYAVKKLQKKFTQDNDVSSRFVDEAKLGARLQHPNIVQVYDLGRVNDELYMATEFVDGFDLRRVLRFCLEKRKRIPLDIALFIVREILSGLAYAHRQVDAEGHSISLIHRDISPQNVLVSFEGEVKIIDFGLAKSTQRTQETQANVLLGNFGYMSPEQARGQPLDVRTDVYSAGIVLFELVTGSKRFVEENPLRLLELVARPTPIVPSDRLPGSPRAIDRIYTRATMPSRDARYENAEAFRDEVTTALHRINPRAAREHLAQFLNHLFLGGQPPPQVDPAALDRSVAIRISDLYEMGDPLQSSAPQAEPRNAFADDAPQTASHPLMRQARAGDVLTHAQLTGEPEPAAAAGLPLRVEAPLSPTDLRGAAEGIGNEPMAELDDVVELMSGPEPTAAPAQFLPLRGRNQQDIPRPKAEEFAAAAPLVTPSALQGGVGLPSSAAPASQPSVASAAGASPPVSADATATLAMAAAPFGRDAAPGLEGPTEMNDTAIVPLTPIDIGMTELPAAAAPALLGSSSLQLGHAPPFGDALANGLPADVQAQLDAQLDLQRQIDAQLAGAFADALPMALVEPAVEFPPQRGVNPQDGPRPKAEDLALPTPKPEPVARAGDSLAVDSVALALPPGLPPPPPLASAALASPPRTNPPPRPATPSAERNPFATPAAAAPLRPGQELASPFGTRSDPGTLAPLAPAEPTEAMPPAPGPATADPVAADLQGASSPWADVASSPNIRPAARPLARTSTTKTRVKPAEEIQGPTNRRR